MPSEVAQMDLGVDETHSIAIRIALIKLDCDFFRLYSFFISYILIFLATRGYLNTSEWHSIVNIYVWLMELKSPAMSMPNADGMANCIFYNRWI